MSYEDVKQAMERIKPYIHRTPLLTSHTFNQMTGKKLYFKCENFQKVGAFKFRGACNAVFQLSNEQAAKGVITHSSGNHAQALALAAKMRGIPAYVVMPNNAPESKKSAVKDYGAIITFCEPTVKSREETCKSIQALRGSSFVSPYDDLRVIAGQGTSAVEMLEDVAELDAIIAPLGGGGLLSGICIAAKAIKPNIVIIGAEPEGADDAYRSMKSGHRILQTNPQTICDGLRTSLGEHNWTILKKHCDDVITVSDEDVKNAMFLIWERMKIIVEPSGVIGFAVVLSSDYFKKHYAHLKNIGIVFSGGNLDLKDWSWSKL